MSQCWLNESDRPGLLCYLILMIKLALFPPSLNRSELWSENADGTFLDGCLQLDVLSSALSLPALPAPQHNKP